MNLSESCSVLNRRLFSVFLCFGLGGSLAAPCARANVLAAAAAFPSVEGKMAFQRDMRKLLQSPFADFMEALETADDSGRTFWHRIAEKKDLAEELETLLRILSVSREEQPWPKTFSLGGLEIGMSGLEREPLAQAAMAGDIASFVNEAENLAETASALEVLSILHGTSSGGDTLYGLVMKGFEKAYGGYEDYESRREKIENSISRIDAYFRDIFWQKDKNGLSPAAAAKKRGNKRGHSALLETSEVTLKQKAGILKEGAIAETEVFDMPVRDIVTQKSKTAQFLGAVGGFGLAAYILSYNPLTDGWFALAWKTPVVLWAASKGRNMVKKCQGAFSKKKKAKPARSDS